MEKFLVEFKDLKKQRVIESQSDAVAKEWAERQLKAWNEESKIVVTPYLVQEAKAEKPVEAKPEEKPRKRTKRAPKEKEK